jgi:2,3-bisphosphoglycerate-independent phosphoglycerate mutase
VEYLNSSYQKEVSDEFILPAACEDFSGVGDGDMVLFFNFRADRARQLTRAFTQNEFQSFRREGLPTLTQFIRMTPYEEGSDLPTAFQKPKVPMTLAEVLSQKGMKQLRIAETEKYAHVTYFFNGGDEKIWDGEKRVLVPSPREVPTYDQKPEMSAVLVTDTLLKELQENKYQFVVVNFANPDMVGHTGNLRAAIKAVETVDGCLKRILDWVRGHDAFADHGNCEKMKDDQGRVLTSHTLLPVPFVLVDPSRKNIELRSSGKLCDIAPTLLALWGISQPKEMTGQSLLD